MKEEEDKNNSQLSDEISGNLDGTNGSNSENTSYSHEILLNKMHSGPEEGEVEYDKYMVSVS